MDNGRLVDISFVIASGSERGTARAAKNITSNLHDIVHNTVLEMFLNVHHTLLKEFLTCSP
jgi:hypothetical protein